MHRHQTTAFPIPEKLNPSLPLPSIVKKADVIDWESSLKDCLLPWMTKPESPFEVVRDELLQKMLDSDGEGLSCPIDSKRRQVQKSEAVADESNLQLLLDLHHRRGLPAIMFNYDRSECEKIMRFVIAKLEEYELRWKNTSKEWLKTMSEYETWKRSQEKSTKAPAAVKMSTLDEDVSKLDIIREQTTKDASKWEYFDPDQPLPRFSFADSRACPSEDLEGLLKRLRWSNLHPTFINGLKRGVGVHHAGMNRQYRQV